MVDPDAGFAYGAGGRSDIHDLYSGGNRLSAEAFPRLGGTGVPGQSPSPHSENLGSLDMELDYDLAAYGAGGEAGNLPRLGGWVSDVPHPLLPMWRY